ncbi:MAG: rod shape-determining protein MreC [Pseudomonadales bacterium]|nr:rod shape-determining protein MreC [Pseudomonadales bacterium]MDP4640069.1 rod shape-determining protein MreC [Pseudomonadales bacterium]MDP4765416.1 rod shape-determining protein MreC [Pseudomonadales bacterium]MDP4875035.1 rod shape-determining protein MreC [Pseudomonadales bacterium]MDP4910787.1 rod shape-determining protein MreC [Pseudomonadales bacterium]
MGFRMLVFSSMALGLLAVDHLSDALDGVRSTLTVLVTPIVYVADYPSRSVEGAQEIFASRSDMREQLVRQEQEVLLLRAKTEKMAALTAENNRLRSLLGSAAKLQDNVLVAELIGVDPDPERLQVIIDKGTEAGVFVGQPLLDAEGLMGQVIETSLFTSRVLLISDDLHSVPVQVIRSNLRLIAQGAGASGLLELVHVPDTADIRVGDALVSSGLGNRFPVGYPVGTVNRVEHDPGKPFALVTAVPSASLAKSRHVLLVFTEEQMGRANAGQGAGQAEAAGGAHAQ